MDNWTFENRSVDDNEDKLTVDGESPCLILLNNDSTEGIVLASQNTM